MSSSPTTLPQKAAFILSVLFLQGEDTSLDPPPTHLDPVFRRSGATASLATPWLAAATPLLF